MKPGILNIIQLALMLLFLSACSKEVVITQKEKPEVTLTGNDQRFTTSSVHLVKDTVYILASNIVIGSGQVFTIDAGTLIKVKPKVSITINAGGKIEANGTKDQPVVFTSSANKGSAGLLVNNSGGDQIFWYGLKINGSPGSSSGNLHYVRIEFAGGNDFDYGASSLSLMNVSNQTSLEHIQVSYSFQTPSFYFAGGDVNAAYLISFACTYSDFVFDNGYNGKLQYLIAHRHPYFSAPDGSGTTMAGVFLMGDATRLSASNITVLGPDSQNGTSQKYFDTTSRDFFGSIIGSKVAAMVINSGKFKIRNSVFCGFPHSAVYLDNAVTASSLQQDESEFSYSVFESDNRNRTFFLPANVYPPYGSNELRDFLLRQEYQNQQFYDIQSFDFSDPYNYDVNPNIRLTPASPLTTGANFDGPVFNDSFFKQVSYRGAIISGDDWLGGWTNFLPLQTDYNP